MVLVLLCFGNQKITGEIVDEMPRYLRFVNLEFELGISASLPLFVVFQYFSFEFGYVLIVAMHLMIKGESLIQTMSATKFNRKGKKKMIV